MKIVESEIIIKGYVKAYTDDGNVRVPLYISLDNGLVDNGQIEVSSFELVEPNTRDLSRDEKILRLIREFDRANQEYVYFNYEKIQSICDELRELGVEVIDPNNARNDLYWRWTDDSGVVHTRLKRH